MRACARGCFCSGVLARARRPCAKGAEQYEVAHALWMAHRIGGRHWPALRDAEQREPIEPGIHDGL